MIHKVEMSGIDHRTRVAADRRERMRARLMEAALLVFGSDGADAGVIDDVIRQANVSRGTFYNYFKNSDDLLRAVAMQAGDDLMAAAMILVERQQDPAKRVAVGVRSWISLVQQFPQLAAFFRRAGLYILESKGVRTELPRDLVNGMASGRFSVKELELGFVLVAGTVLAAINTLAIGNIPRTFGGKLAQRILMSLGIDEAEARSITRKRMANPRLSQESLILRATVQPKIA